MKTLQTLRNDALLILQDRVSHYLTTTGTNPELLADVYRLRSDTDDADLLAVLAIADAFLVGTALELELAALLEDLQDAALAPEWEDDEEEPCGCEGESCPGCMRAQFQARADADYDRMREENDAEELARDDADNMAVDRYRDGD